MTPYFCMFSLISIFSIFDNFKDFRERRLFFFILTVTMLILFSGLRKLGVGADDISYYNIFFDRVPDLYNWLFGNWSYDILDVFIEPGYLFVNSVVLSLAKDYRVLFLVVGFLSVGIAFLKYYRCSNYVFLTLLLFFVHIFLYRYLNQIRAAVAAALGLFLISQIHKKRAF